nr:outer membrane beta-barrel protein [Elizabethkingia argenteiflava]
MTDIFFSVNFGRRIGRPGFWELNPARRYSSPKSYATGNSFLQPSFVYNYVFNYSYKSLLNLNLNYANIKDITGQLTYHDVPEDMQIFKRLNYAHGKYMGGNISVTFKPFKWWESSTDFSVNYGELTPYVNILANKYSGWQGYTSSINTFTLNRSKTFFTSLYYEYNTPQNQDTA